MDKKENKHFDSSQFHGNVVFNYSHDPKSEFSLYAYSYYKAAITLVEKLQTSPSYSDFDAAPIVFLYRQSVELYLKGIIITCRRIAGLLGKPQNNTKITIHNMKRLLEIVEKEEMNVLFETGILDKSDGNMTQNLLKLKEYIEEIDKYDRESDSFRYPIDKEGKASLEEHFRFNVIEFAEKMEPIVDFLNKMDGWIKDQLQEIQDQIEYCK